MRAAQFLATIGRGSKGSNALEVTEDRAGATSEQQDNVINTVNSLDPYGPSWQLVPTLMKEDVIPAPIPTSGLGDLTFTRASDATRTNSAGEIERTPWNLLQQSEMFSNAVWVSDGTTTVTANTETAPNGTLTADRLQMSASQRRYVYQIITPTQTTYTYSVYLRANSNQTVRISVDQGCANYRGGLICNVTTQWQRFSITLSNIVISSGVVAIVIDNITSNTNACTGTASAVDIYAWGAQLVEGTDAKPYFATTNRQDVPRLDYRNADGTLSSCPRLLLEPQRTNSIRNSTMVGAVAGSPGTLPTNWTNAGSSGLTQTIVGVGTELGLQYLDIRYAGTANVTDVFRILFEYVTASNGQTWTTSFYAKAVSQANPAASYAVRMTQRTSAGSPITNTSSSFTIDSNLKQFTLTTTNAGGGTVALVTPEIQFAVTSGQTYDFTIRIAAPQMELGAYATTFIPTTTAAVTRLVDAASKTGVSSLIGQTEGTLFIDINYNQPTSDANGRLLQVYAGTETTNAILPLIFGSGANVNQFQLAVSSAGASTVAIVASAATLVPFGRQKFAIAYNAGVYTVYRNGSLFASATNVAPTSLSVIELGGSSSVARNLSNPINQAALFTRRLTNAELAAITTL